MAVVPGVRRTASVSLPGFSVYHSHGLYSAYQLSDSSWLKSVRWTRPKLMISQTHPRSCASSGLVPQYARILEPPSFWGFGAVDTLLLLLSDTRIEKTTTPRKMVGIKINTCMALRNHGREGGGYPGIENHNLMSSLSKLGVLWHRFKGPNWLLTSFQPFGVLSYDGRHCRLLW